MNPYIQYFRKYTFKGKVDRNLFIIARKEVLNRLFSNKKILTIYELKCGFDMLLKLS